MFELLESRWGPRVIKTLVLLSMIRDTICVLNLFSTSSFFLFSWRLSLMRVLLLLLLLLQLIDLMGQPASQGRSKWTKEEKEMKKEFQFSPLVVATRARAPPVLPSCRRAEQGPRPHGNGFLFFCHIKSFIPAGKLGGRPGTWFWARDREVKKKKKRRVLFDNFPIFYTNTSPGLCLIRK